MVKITIAVNKVERTLEIDPDDIPMQFYADLEEAGETKKMTAIMHTYAAAIGFTPEEIGQISRRDFNRIVEAINTTSKDAGAIPNG
jgi:hypothetical protein